MEVRYLATGVNAQVLPGQVAMTQNRCRWTSVAAAGSRCSAPTMKTASNSNPTTLLAFVSVTPSLPARTFAPTVQLVLRATLARRSTRLSRQVTYSSGRRTAMDQCSASGREAGY